MARPGNEACGRPHPFNISLSKLPHPYPFIAEVNAQGFDGRRPRVVVLENFNNRFRIYTLEEIIIPCKETPLFLRAGVSYTATGCLVDLDTAVPIPRLQ